MDKEIGKINGFQKEFWTDLDLMEDRVMDVKMSAKGAHTMLAPLKEDVWDLNDTVANLSNQIEMVHVEDIAWCRSWIVSLEKAQQPRQQVPLVACQPNVSSDRGSARPDLGSSGWDGWNEGKGWGSGDVVGNDPVEGVDH
jgi:hypothetical protein